MRQTAHNEKPRHAGVLQTFCSAYRLFSSLRAVHQLNVCLLYTSIICPAAVAGLVGMKPTVGLISRDGIIPISFSQDTAGPMTRSVADTAALLTALDGPDTSDAASNARPKRAPIDYISHLNAEGLKGARIGVVRKLMGFEPATDAVMEQAIAALKAAGATVVDAQIPTLGQWDDAESEVLKYEFKPCLLYTSRCV